MYAIIRDRGRQYRVQEGEVLDIDLLDGKKDGDTVEFKDVLLTAGGEGQVKVGEPHVSGASVTGVVVMAEVKGEKIDVVHFRRRKDSKTTRGHRQRYTRVKVQRIEVAG